MSGALPSVDFKAVNFQSEQGMYDAVNSDNPFIINYMPDSTMPPAVPSVGSTDDQMEDWVTAANKYSTDITRNGG